MLSSELLGLSRKLLYNLSSIDKNNASFRRGHAPSQRQITAGPLTRAGFTAYCGERQQRSQRPSIPVRIGSEVYAYIEESVV